MKAIEANVTINERTGKPWCTTCSCLGCPGGIVGHFLFNANSKFGKYKKQFKAWKASLGKPKLSELEDIEVEGVDTADHPDFCDAYISYATYKGRELTEAELDWVNQQSDFVYECALEQVF